MDYRMLLKKYINRVSRYEGTTFLKDHQQHSHPGTPKFTDEEWDKLQELELEDPELGSTTHSCSCHTKNQGPCGLCKVLGCEVWNFNQYATPSSVTTKHRMRVMKSDNGSTAFWCSENECELVVEIEHDVMNAILTRGDQTLAGVSDLDWPVCPRISD